MKQNGIKLKYQQAIIAVLKNHTNLKKAVLFGSRAMETYTPKSDIDIALFGEALTLSDQASISEQIEEIDIPQKVDLLLYATLKNEKLKAHIEKHGITWYEKKQRWDMGSDWQGSSLDRTRPTS